MTSLDYKTAGVDIEQGDKASRSAYHNAKKTFVNRSGMIGQPYALEGGFSGALDMGDFLLVQNDDGVGTKMEIAERTKIYKTLGHDLCAMVADDALCVGAEVISLTNTADVPHIDADALAELTEGLAEICSDQKIVIPGGEIAELSNALNSMVWNATAVGVVEKEKYITGNKVSSGDVIIGLKGRVIRSNGTSLARKICETSFGDEWHNKEWNNGMTWGEVLLTPSKVYHKLVLDTVLGRFKQERPFDVHGVVHITGGGVPGNVPRILPDGLGARFDTLHKPHPAVQDLKELGDIAESECYRTWHCGTALMLVVDPKDVDNVMNVLNDADNEVEAQIVGQVTDTNTIEVVSQFSGNMLSFPRD